MASQHSRTRERGAVLVIALVLVIARSAVFVFVSGSHFDSDQAVTGLMAKHLGEGRAFPVFWYGQAYLLAVEAWLAAPVMRVAGASVTALKAPLLAINLAVAFLLLRLFEREAGLRPALAALAALFFVVPSPITTAHFLTANGGNIEPLLYVLLLWPLRRRPVWLGLVLGIGFLNREFTVYGAIALIVLQAARGAFRTRDGWIRAFVMVAMAACVWVAAQGLHRHASAAGPGTTVADLYSGLPSNNLVELVRRTCLAPRAMVRGAGALFTVHWPELFGLERQRLTDFGIESTTRQGWTGAAWLLVAVFGIPILRVTAAAARERGWPSRCDVCAYLVLVSLLSAAGYITARCGEVNFYTMRYELLSALGACGLAAWYLAVERVRALRTAWISAVALVIGVSLTAHARLAAEYLTGPPVPAKQALIEQLDARGVRYGYADFWVAYYVTFMTREHVQLAATDAVRIRTYNRIVDAHRNEAVRVSRTPCAGGTQVTSAFWLCAP